MKKKTLSLALALAVCLGLAMPAFAEEAKAGDTTVTDDNGVTYQLSNPIIRVEPIANSSDNKIVYIVPEGTSVIPVSAEGYELTESDGFVQFKKTDNDHIVIWSSTLGMGLGNSSKEGIVIEKSEGEQYPYGFESNHWVDDNSTDACVYFLCGEPDSQPTDPAPADPAAPAYQVSNWAKDRVALAVEAGLAPEGLGNDYRVGITRAQFAAVSVKLYEAMSGGKAPAVSENPFTDTEDPVILQAADLGFVSGVGGGKFDPDAPVNREQAAVMLASVYTKLGGEIPAVEATSFGDDGDISGWARNAVDFMNGKEIVTGIGDNNFGPKGGASIEQALLISLKMFEALK